MIKHYIRKYRSLLAACALTAFVSSCTYDYFVDENNFYLYVPQIEERTIENFYVAFHDASSGAHVRTRFVERSQFGADTLLSRGLLRFKLPAGARLTMTCFADIPAGETVTTAESYANSCVSLPAHEQYGSVFTPTEDFRALSDRVDILPIGHPESQTPHTADMHEGLVHKACINVHFKNLPAQVATVAVSYTGLGHCLHFDGHVAQDIDACHIAASYPLAEAEREGDLVKFHDMHYASTGSEIFTADAASRAGAADDIPLLGATLHFRDASGADMGSTIVTQEDFTRLNPDFDGRLDPRESITLLFDQFVLVGLELTPWGDSTPGEPTPM